MDNLNKIWDSFEEGFLFAAKQNFPTNQISREIKKCIDSIQKTEWPKIFERTNMHLHEINIRHEIGIQLINSTDQNEKEAANLKETENFIELCYKHIQNEQSKILNSLLDQPYNKIKIDRVLDQKEENLVTYATEVKNKTQAFFQSQYKKRNTRLEDLPDK
ncbi:44698_t:CDS:2 [Gigaspora margarita]|uniref:44698_t:CDS:1 n=1 Tax=Gigaspora margarita TaxID=4874 RepID=A0ABN7V798_GIGMA|nr:44698_t:CDS:2 [Gigaspora margarita]